MARASRKAMIEGASLYARMKLEEERGLRTTFYSADEAAAKAGDPFALYRWRNDYMRVHGFSESDPDDFYRDLFPVGSFERQGRQDDRRPNGIITRVLKTDAADVRGRGSHRLITDDLDALRDPAAAFGIDTRTAGEAQIFICSPIGYSGRRPTNKGAYKAYALAVDLDNVGVKEHGLAVHQMCVNRNLPTPTYIVSSGNGLHLYYLMEQPVALMPQASKALIELKHRLIERVWNGDTSRAEKRQYHGIVQGFRIVGQPSKLGADYPVRAWRTGDRVNLEWLNEVTRYQYGKDKPVITDFSIFDPNVIRPYVVPTPSAEPPKWWALNRAVYDHFLYRVREKDEAQAGHRYNCILTLAIFATKCGVSREELERDAYALIPQLDRKSDTKHGAFTRQEVEDALKIYGTPEAHKKRRAWIETKTAISMPANKRNGRTQVAHLKRARFSQELDYPDGSWRQGNGRPSKYDEILEYRIAHPYASKADCIRATGISKPTVYRWWDAAQPMSLADAKRLIEALKSAPPMGT